MRTVHRSGAPMQHFEVFGALLEPMVHQRPSGGRLPVLPDAALNPSQFGDVVLVFPKAEGALLRNCELSGPVLSGVLLCEYVIDAPEKLDLGLGDGQLPQPGLCEQPLPRRRKRRVLWQDSPSRRSSPQSPRFDRGDWSCRSASPSWIERSALRNRERAGHVMGCTGSRQWANTSAPMRLSQASGCETAESAHQSLASRLSGNVRSGLQQVRVRGRQDVAGASYCYVHTRGLSN